MLAGRFTNGDRLCPPAPRRSLLNSYATQHTAHERVAVAQPTTRAAAGSERWQQGQTRPGHLSVHAVEADRASRCALSARTASDLLALLPRLLEALGTGEQTG